MTALAGTTLTLADWAKRLDPDGKVPEIVEMMSQTNEILLDALWKEGNLPTGERVNIRTGLPDVYFRLINQGIPPSKSTTAQVDEQCGLMEGLGVIDQDLVELNGNSAAFRMSENSAYIEAMNQRAAKTMIYGASTTPEEFVGLAERFSSLSAVNAKNIISAGSVSGGDSTSIYLIGWGPNTCYGVFPKGSQAGLVHQDMGVDWAFDANNNRYRAYMDHYKWKLGLVVKDWRYVVRICNIDVSALVADPTGGTINLINLMLKALHRLPSYAGGMIGNAEEATYRGVRPVFYANRTIREMLDIQAQNKTNLLLSVGNEEGNPKTMLRGIPVRTLDVLTESEAVVS